MPNGQIGLQCFDHLVGDSSREHRSTSTNALYRTRGLIGPRRIFGTGSPYASILWALLAGALAPLPAWLLAKRFPRQTWLHHVNFPVMLSGASYIPPANGINYTSWFLGAFIFRT